MVIQQNRTHVPQIFSHLLESLIIPQAIIKSVRSYPYLGLQISSKYMFRLPSMAYLCTKIYVLK